MSWLYSQALVEEYWEGNSLDGEQSALSSGKPIQQAYCAPDKMTDFSRLSRFGMTFKPLTESLGEELLTLYLAGFHAKTFQSQEVELDLTENDQECGEKWQGLLARFDPDSHLWRTAQCSLLEDLNECLQTLPQWGMTVGGELYLLPMLVQCTNVNESGLSLNSPPPPKKWPTPTAYDGQGGTMPNWKPVRPSGHPAQYPLKQALRDSTGILGKPNPIFVEWLMGWPLNWTTLMPLKIGSKPLETGKSHCVQQQHGESLQKDN